MKNLNLQILVKVVFSLFMVVSAAGEISANETVLDSMDLIEMPSYLLVLLGFLKVLGVLALWFSPYRWIKEWAYAGFVFDFVGAIFAFMYLGKFPFPDIIMAPIALLLCIWSYVLWKKHPLPMNTTPNPV